MLKIFPILLVFSGLAHAGISEEEMKQIQAKCNSQIGNQSKTKTISQTWKAKTDAKTDKQIPIFVRDLKTTKSIVLKVDGSKQYSLDTITDGSGKVTTEVSFQDVELPKDIETLIRQYGELDNGVVLANYGEEGQIEEIINEDFTIKAYGKISIKIDVRKNKCDFMLKLIGNRSEQIINDKMTVLKDDFYSEVNVTTLDNVSEDNLKKLDLTKVTFCDHTSEEPVCENEKDMSFLFEKKNG